GVIKDAPGLLVDRDVEVHADEDALAADVDVADGLLVHEGSLPIARLLGRALDEECGDRLDVGAALVVERERGDCGNGGIGPAMCPAARNNPRGRWRAGLGGARCT